MEETKIVPPAPTPPSTPPSDSFRPSSPPTPPASSGPSTPPPSHHHDGLKLGILGIALVVALLYGGAKIYMKQVENATPQTPPPVVISPEPTPTVPDPTPIPDGTFTSWINVKWDAQPTVQDDKCPLYLNDQASCKDVLAVNYKIGTVTDGQYANQTLYLSQMTELGTSYYHYIIKDGKKLQLDSPQVDSVKIGIRGIDDVVTEINFPLKANYKLKKSWTGQQMFQDTQLVTKLFTDPVLGDAYLTSSGCIVFRLPDGTALSFDPEVPFINMENGQVTATINGVETHDQYMFRIPTCAANCYYWDIVPETEINPSTRLKVMGKTSNNEDIYGYADPNDKDLKDIYNDKSSVAYYSDDWSQHSETNKYTYEQFIKLNPVIYWKDPLNRLIRFKNYKITPAAEMCKPVIYLYPETVKKVNVTVQPTGGFTKTIPAYNNGWNVIATPSGKIFDLGSSQVYDYLFWEGMGLNYPVSKEGFVVKRADIKGFLDEKLPLLGLQGQEIIDFEEYWVQRLGARPYYKLNFIPKVQFDEVAPLSVSGDPKTMIRVMMTATGLDEYQDMPEQEIGQTPARRGFTVVEWGGVVWE